MVFYLCKRGWQCKHPCEKNCFFTTDFFNKSILFDKNKDIVTSVRAIPFQQDKNGDWWEVDLENPEKNLPDSLQRNPPKFININYEYILQLERKRDAEKKLQKANVEKARDKAFIKDLFSNSEALKDLKDQGVTIS